MRLGCNFMHKIVYFLKTKKYPEKELKHSSSGYFDYLFNLLFHVCLGSLDHNGTFQTFLLQFTGNTM